jgi:hypothetical protein
VLALGGTRLLAVLTFGGMKRICLPSAVLRLARPLMTIGLDDEGISILMGLLRKGDVIPIFGGAVDAADVVALFFSAKAAAVSRSFPPPVRR